ncbi:MAG: nucleotidyl transferase AbiEii/AbiGii toxin family protein [Lentisphaerae bacterium]|nr:nucleotidyl transferase AbiEii/AbiGii toxin family protein [Lentisphaerota bacterium]
MRLLAAQRNPENYLAGATILHRDSSSPRYSEDLDFFHDVEESVAGSAELDADVLRRNGYGVDWVLRAPTFYRAVVRKADEQIKLEWAVDTAFRFFPVERDELCGYRLHPTDAAINKLLALAGRREIRDFVDTLYVHETSLSLGALAWAACGKDPGYTPELLLDQMGRHAIYTDADLARLELARPLRLADMKRQWLQAQDQALRLVQSLPASELGCLYLGSNGRPATPDPELPDFSSLLRHWGSLKGAWPVFR